MIKASKRKNDSGNKAVDPENSSPKGDGKAFGGASENGQVGQGANVNIKPENQPSDSIESGGGASSGSSRELPKKMESQSKEQPLFVELSKIVLLALLIIIPIRIFVFKPFFVEGNSMEPNFHDGQYLIINEWGYKKTALQLGQNELFSVGPFRELDRGSIVVFRYPLDPKKHFIKRVVGLPGEHLVIKNGKIRIFNNDHPEGFFLEEDYLSNHTQTKGEKDFVLSDDQYVVLGDNRSHSSDSRSWGVLPEDLVVGKVLIRAWPVREFTLFE